MLREKLKDIGSIILLAIILTVFWICLFHGIIAEQDRKEKQKPERKWLYEQALNERDTELIRAIKEASK